MEIIFIIIALLMLIIGSFLYYKGNNALKEAKKIEVWKDCESEQKQRHAEALFNEINELTKNKEELISYLGEEQKRIDERIKEVKNNYFEQLNIYKKNIDYAKEEYASILEDHYEAAEIEHDELIKQYKDEVKDVKTKLNELKNSLSAGVQAQLRERKKEENLQFYKLSISPIDLEDITKLCSLKIALHNPVILSKLIWTQYFQKQTTEMCNRVFGKDTVCGIYKITNIKTQQCYIGQSVNIQDRMKQHIKCGLGIDAPATNKLYNAMQTDGVWNYTFELIEKCKREELDRKEKQWIEMYQSREFGYNSTRGNN